MESDDGGKRREDRLQHFARLIGRGGLPYPLSSASRVKCCVALREVHDALLDGRTSSDTSSTWQIANSASARKRVTRPVGLGVGVVSVARSRDRRSIAAAGLLCAGLAVHLPVWDRLFGTFHLPGEHWPKEYVTVHALPKSLWRQFAYPFRRGE